MIFKGLKNILLAGFLMSMVEILISSNSIPEAKFELLIVYTLAFSCAYFIFAVPFQLFIHIKGFFKKFSILSLSLYILGSFFAFFIINISDFNLELSFFKQVNTYIHIFMTAIIFWVCESLCFDDKG
ncbi:UPF0715 family protein [Bacillus thuringiensis]|uniref:UPF0715 family protein n=1 Tax=Bacillus thuringiensis TaxID=1428 RepID=UPI000BFD6AB0|nr:UPF0715 family protein [Bacillus thuringiensis]PGO53053.1 hypothetical protein CN986_21170 [Bacillus thuringiensis]